MKSLQSLLPNDISIEMFNPLIFIGFLIGDPGQNCTNACNAIDLACYWPKGNQFTNLQAEFESNGLTCQRTDPKWRKEWHPAYFSNESKCVGFEDVKESSCKNVDELDVNIKRLCHCIYKGKSSLIISIPPS